MKYGLKGDIKILYDSLYRDIYDVIMESVGEPASNKDILFLAIYKAAFEFLTDVSNELGKNFIDKNKNIISVGFYLQTDFELDITYIDFDWMLINRYESSNLVGYGTDIKIDINDYLSKLRSYKLKTILDE